MLVNGVAERVGAKVSGWPRPLQIAFVIWVSVGLFGFFFSVPLGIMLAVFDAPSVLSAGRIPALMDRHLLLVSFIFGLPIGLLTLIAEERSNWDTRRDKLQRGVLAGALAVFIWTLGWLSASTTFHGLAVATNAISKPPLRSWSLEISGTELHAGDRRCNKSLYFEDPIVPEHRTNICVYSLSPLFHALAGDVLDLTGRPGPFGITYRRDDLFLEPASR